jgi:hypothetical protein
MKIRSLLVALACAFSVTSFIVAGAHAETDDVAGPLECPPFCPDQGKAHDGSQKRYQDRSYRRDRDRSHRRDYDQSRKRDHDRSRKHYDDGDRDFEQKHRKSYRHHKRSHSRGKVRLRIYQPYYDPFYNDPFYDDRYYDRFDEPDYGERLTCRQAIAELRNLGYRNVKAYDCRGESYGFYATRHSKKYKIILSSLDGDITSRRRIAR